MNAGSSLFVKARMIDNDLIGKIRQLKEEKRYTLHDLSRITDIQVATLGRWLRTGHINKVYARLIKDRLGIE